MAPQVTIYPPPGPSILNLRSQVIKSPTSVASAQRELPSDLESAVALRFTVFVDEQKASPESEIDSDDARSWHWVVLADRRDAISLSDNGRHVHKDGGIQKEQIVASTLRLVPVSSSAAVIQEISSEGLAAGPIKRRTALWDGFEPYIKIGRVATLPSHRGMGLGKLLIESAVEWAGRHREILRHSTESFVEGNMESSSENQWNGLILVHAQTAVKGFWEKMGFLEDVGMGVWFEEGCEHIGMWRRVDTV